MEIKNVISKSEFIFDQYVAEFNPADQNGQSINPKGTFFIFHGFPSWRTKNYDIAEILSLEGYQVFVFHQLGLGLSKGGFEFKKSKDLVQKTLESIENRILSSKTYFIGHSWGGFMSVLLSDYCSEAMYLIAPLSFLPEQFNANFDEFGKWVHSIDPSDYPETYTAGDIASEFREMYPDWHSKIRDLSDSSKTINIYHGTSDDVLEVVDSKKLANALGAVARLYQNDDDHTMFIDRKSFLNKLTSDIRNI